MVARHGSAMFGANAAEIAVPRASDGELRLLNGVGPSAAPDLPLAAAYRTGLNQVHADRGELVRDFPSLDLSGPEASLASPLHAGERIVGALGFTFDAPREFGSDDLDLLDAVAGLAAVVLEQAKLYAESRAEAEQQRFLASASELVGSSLDLDETLDTLAELAVPSFADGVAVDRVDDDGVRRVARHPAGLPLPESFPLGDTIGEPRLVPVVTDELLAGEARDLEQLAALRALGLSSWISVPIHARDQLYGVLTFVQAQSGRTYTEHDLAIATDLARRAGAALENALLYEGVRTAEREVAQAQRMFARIADATPDILFVAELPSGRNVYVNRDMSKVLGHSTEDVRANSEGMLRAYVHPEDLLRVYEDFARIPTLADGELIEHGFRVRHAEGHWRWLDVRSVVFTRDDEGRPSQLLSVARDVTDEREQALALSRSEQRYRLATTAVGGVVYDMDLVADRVTQSPGLFGLTGFHPAEETSTISWWRSRIHPDDQAAVALALTEAHHRGKNLVESEYRLQHKDGTFRWVWDRARLECDERGEVVRLVGCTTDITDQVRATEALEAADQRKDEFLALVGHELRNPLAAVRNAADVLSRTAQADPRVVRARDVIVRQVGHMARMLDDLLDLSRLTRDKLMIRAEPIDLTGLVRQIVDEQRPDLEATGIPVELLAPPDPVYVRGDRTRLAQVVTNLMDNAGKYSDPGGRISVRVSLLRDRVELVIEDAGIGIEAKHLPEVFEPFVQGERRVEASNGGLGLGLALVKGLVELHGGDVRATSGGAGHGATFTITLPRVDPPSLGDTRSEVGSACRKVLIVEDNQDAAEMLRTLLVLDGHSVELAHDGGTALDRAPRFAPDVVLCDIGLPGSIDGYEIARTLRANGSRAFLVALTGYGQPEDQRRAMAAGFDRHVTKPVDPSELERLIQVGPG